MTTITEEAIFQQKQQLQEEITQFETQLQEHREEQAKIKKIEKLAESILKYDEIVREISDRTTVFSLLSSPTDAFSSPYTKSQLFDYIQSAETVSVELVDFLVNIMLEQLRKEIQSGEDDTVDLIQAEYKEYIIPGKIIAERFDEIDDLLGEMNRYCASVNSDYNPWDARQVLSYAFQKATDADTRMDPTITALKTGQFEYLTPEDRANLLSHVQEHLAVIRYDKARHQQIAMEKAVSMMESREE
jgi:hypothetical protein